MADGFLQYVLSGRDRSVLRRVLTLAGEFLQLGARSDRVCDGLPNGRMRVSLYAYGMVITQSFNGAAIPGLRRGSTSVCFELFEIRLHYALAKGLGIGPWGIFLAITIAFSTLAVVSAGSSNRANGKSGLF